MLHNFCRNVFLNDNEEETTGDSSNADEVYQDDINERLKRVDKNAMNLCVRFLHKRYNPLKLMTVFKSDGQEISTIEWQELKNRFPSFFVHK